MGRQSPFAHEVEGLVNDQDRVVHHHADENHEPEHGQDVQGLEAEETVDEKKSQEASCSGQGHAEHNDERVEKTAEQGGHEQKGNNQGEYEIPLQHFPCSCEVVRRAREIDEIGTAQLA